MVITAIPAQAEEGGQIAWNPETGTPTPGESVAEAVGICGEAKELDREKFPGKS